IMDLQIENVLTRADEVLWRELLGSELVSNLMRFSEAEGTSDLLRAALRIYDETDFLLDELKRNKVFSLLRLTEAKELARSLNLNEENPYEMLTNYRFDHE